MMADGPDLSRMTPEEKKKIVALQNLKLAREKKRKMMEEKKKKEQEPLQPPPPPPSFDFSSNDDEEQSISSIEETPILSTGKKLSSIPYEAKSKVPETKRKKKKQKTTHEPAQLKTSEESSYWDLAKATLFNGNNLYTASFIFISMLLQFGLPIAEEHLKNSVRSVDTINRGNIQIPPPKTNEENMDVEHSKSSTGNHNSPVLSFIV